MSMFLEKKPVGEEWLKYEDMTKNSYGTKVIISESTRQMAGGMTNVSSNKLLICFIFHKALNEFHFYFDGLTDDDEIVSLKEGQLKDSDTYRYIYLETDGVLATVYKSIMINDESVPPELKLAYLEALMVINQKIGVLNKEVFVEPEYEPISIFNIEQEVFEQILTPQLCLDYSRNENGQKLVVSLGEKQISKGTIDLFLAKNKIKNCFVFKKGDSYVVSIKDNDTVSTITLVSARDLKSSSYARREKRFSAIEFINTSTKK